MKMFIGFVCLAGGCYFFLPELFRAIIHWSPWIIGLLIFRAFVCYGWQMIRLFFKF